VLYREVLGVDNDCHDVKEDEKSSAEDPCGTTPQTRDYPSAASKNNQLLAPDEVIFVGVKS
jgi:hypothetical protein